MKKFVVIQTDFGTDNISVSTMKGVCKIVDPSLEIFDSCHAITPFDVLAASDGLCYTIPFWPSDTVFVSVVDPGVGTSRRACVAMLENGSFVVTPDNGTLTYVKERLGIKAVREIDESVNRFPTTRDIHIFHGRDLFSYTAARLASGIIDFEGVGPEYPVSEIVMAPYVRPCKKKDSLSGMIIEATEHFGLLGTNIPFGWLSEIGINYGDKTQVTICHCDKVVYDKIIPLEKSFGFVPLGSDLVFSGETSTIQIATNQGNIVLDNNLKTGIEWTFTIKKA